MEVGVQVELGWGRQPLCVSVPAGARVIHPPEAPGQPWGPVVQAALDAPVDSEPLESLAARCRRVCVLLPDSTRKGVAEGLLPAVLERLRGVEHLSVGIAGGKHPPDPLPVLPEGILPDSVTVHRFAHDAHSPDLLPVGQTAYGTEVAYPRAVVEADLRVVLGEIRPHYFAGYAGGAKGLFPGAAGAQGIWHNHTLKAAPGARLGQIEGNPHRADVEEAAALAGPSFILNLIRAAGGGLAGAVAGDPVTAHRAGVALARPVFEVAAPPEKAPVVLVSDGLPVAMNLYQACKLLVPAGRILAEGGTIILAVSLEDGIGPIQVINEAIYRLGVVHSLPARHRVLIVSEQPAEALKATFGEPVPDVETALGMACADARLVVLPRGGEMVPVAVAARGRR